MTRRLDDYTAAARAWAVWVEHVTRGWAPDRDVATWLLAAAIAVLVYGAVVWG